MLAIHRVGMNKQDLARTVEEAKKLFDQSCNICIYRGINIDCDHCPLAVYHEMNVAAIRDSETFKNKGKVTDKPIVVELNSNNILDSECDK